MRGWFLSGPFVSCAVRCASSTKWWPDDHQTDQTPVVIIVGYIEWNKAVINLSPSDLFFYPPSSCSSGSNSKKWLKAPHSRTIRQAHANPQRNTRPCWCELSGRGLSWSSLFVDWWFRDYRMHFIRLSRGPGRARRWSWFSESKQNKKWLDGQKILLYKQPKNPVMVVSISTSHAQPAKLNELAISPVSTTN